MMGRNRGKSISLDNDRRLICDVIQIANRTPLAPLSMELDVSELKSLRRKIEPRIAWQIIMMRAYALLAVEVPELRRLYSPCPWPNLYEHNDSVCLLTIARQDGDRERLFFARFCQPENHSLLQLQQQFDDYRKRPIKELKQLRHQVQFAALPRPLRWFGWRLLTHWMPASRARQMGTFGMSLSGFRTVDGYAHLSPCTTTLGYDQICKSGNARMTLTFDHRVIDGKPATAVLEKLQVVLKTRLLPEMRMLARTVSDKDQGEILAKPGRKAA